MINGDRVKQVRELRGFTQTELATRIGANQSTITYVESGRLQPSEALMDKIVFQTGFPLSFFQIAHPTNFPMGSSLLFRAKSAMRVREHVLVHRYAETLFECAEKLLQRFRSVPVRLPHLENETPAMAASITRHALGLSPSAPIPDLIYATEKAGVFVLPLPIELDNVDAFSLRIGTNLASPLIVTMQQQFGDRFRFSVAHELGHLVMHQAIAGSVAKVEKEAHQFAGALLLPEDAMREELVPPVTLASLAALKPRWKVSMQSMIMRASDLQIVTARQKKYLFQQMSARGIRKREPAHLDIAIEKPRWLRQMAERLYGTPIDYHAFARDSDLPQSFLEECIEFWRVNNQQQSAQAPVTKFRENMRKVP